MKTLLMILQLIPALLGVIKSVEEMFPKEGEGAKKLKLVREMMEATYGGVKDIWPTLEIIIEKVVGLANDLGVFGEDKKEPSEDEK